MEVGFSDFYKSAENDVAGKAGGAFGRLRLSVPVPVPVPVKGTSVRGMHTCVCDLRTLNSFVLNGRF